MIFSAMCAIMFKLTGEPEAAYAPLAQLDRASGYGPEGQGFESLTACQKSPEIVEISGLFAICCIFRFMAKRAVDPFVTH